MKVLELIEKLQAEDQELTVFVLGYEGGVDDVIGIQTIDVALDVNTQDYYGKHEQLLDDYDKKSHEGYKQIKGILI